VNYPVDDALANIAVYENVAHKCEHVQYARNNTINVIMTNTLEQEDFLIQ